MVREKTATENRERNPGATVHGRSPRNIGDLESSVCVKRLGGSPRGVLQQAYNKTMRVYKTVTPLLMSLKGGVL
jgi:hypothetical protein